MMTTEKRLAGESAALFVKDGMKVGLGTGSTVFFTITKIAEMMGHDMAIVAVPTSVDTETKAFELGIPLIELGPETVLDVTIDGTDEITPDFQLIKGMGAALLREKIVARASKREVIVADPSKLVEQLGIDCALPVEITPFGHRRTVGHIEELGADPVIRTVDGEELISDNGNLIVDCKFPAIPDPAALEAELKSIPGVVETGLFVDLATDLVLAIDGMTIWISKESAASNGTTWKEILEKLR